MPSLFQISVSYVLFISRLVIKCLSPCNYFFWVIGCSQIQSPDNFGNSPAEESLSDVANSVITFNHSLYQNMMIYFKHDMYADVCLTCTKSWSASHLCQHYDPRMYKNKFFYELTTHFDIHIQFFTVFCNPYTPIDYSANQWAHNGKTNLHFWIVATLAKLVGSTYPLIQPLCHGKIVSMMP